LITSAGQRKGKVIQRGAKGRKASFEKDYSVSLLRFRALPGSEPEGEGGGRGGDDTPLRVII